MNSKIEIVPRVLSGCAYLGSLFGEDTSTTNDMIVFHHGDKWAVTLYLDGSKMEYNAELPTDKYYAVVGYCAIQQIEHVELWEC